MLAQAAQAVAPALEAGKSGMTVFFDAGIIGLIITNSALLLKAMIDRRAVKKAKDAEGPGPGESATCRAHGEAISKLEEFQGNTKGSLERIEGKVDRLLERPR